ncbi:hypothetical protein Neosp_012294 [[Neocosmospora] mangrovei]
MSLEYLVALTCGASIGIKRKRATAESKIKFILEEYDTEKKRGTEGIDRIKELMQENDIIKLLPGAVPGFVLRSRKWVLLDLLRLEPVAQDDEWRHLVLPPGHRQLVQAMVETHTQELSPNIDAKIGIDLVRGKGRGCIILLHGVPGVGKTSTAGKSQQCVAVHTKKPLYPITCVFLRILEYYSGILFLTTNRVGAIDDAFRSRLHLTLYYPKLTKKQTKQIFKHNFERIADINANRKLNGLPPFEYKDTEPKIMAWAMETWKALRWNGRQIRNAFQTVLALAEFYEKSRGGESAPRVIVANASTQFNDYLLATHGMDEDKVANREYMRALSYSPSSQLVFKGFNQDSSESSCEEEESGDDSETGNGSDEFDESEKEKKRSRGKGREGREERVTSAAKNGRSGKKQKEIKKEVKDSDDSDDSDI